MNADRLAVVFGMKELTVKLSDDLYKYLSFLEQRHFIESKESAVRVALELYKMLAMHEWLPNFYKLSGSRVVLLDDSMLKGIFETITNEQMYTAGRITALKRLLEKPYVREAELTNPENWPLILRELEIMGWGTFTKVKDEVKITACAVPLPYLRGYLETLFGVELKPYPAKIPDVTVLIAGRKKTEVWR
ncbi:MAG: hypothetical protein QW587_07955 [Candidatus Bathyarchaeia archaeon]